VTAAKKAADSPRRYASCPTRLEAPDFEAILAQAVDPEAEYRVEGWILAALAGELLEMRAGRAKRPKDGKPPKPRPSRPRVLPGQLDLPFGEASRAD